MIERIFQKKADAGHQNQNAQPQQPLAGHGIFHRHSLGQMFFADDDPVPDFFERLDGGQFELARLSRRRRRPGGGAHRRPVELGLIGRRLIAGNCLDRHRWLWQDRHRLERLRHRGLGLRHNFCRHDLGRWLDGFRLSLYRLRFAGFVACDSISAG